MENVSRAAKDDLAAYGIPVIGPLGNPEIWSQQPKDMIKHIFVSYPHYEDEGEFLVRHAVIKLGMKKIAVFYQNDDYGKGLMEAFMKEATEIGLEFLEPISYIRERTPAEGGSLVA